MDVGAIDAEDNLHEALQKLLDSGYDKLPVMNTTDEGGKRVLGLSDALRSDAGVPRGSPLGWRDKIDLLTCALAIGRVQIVLRPLVTVRVVGQAPAPAGSAKTASSRRPARSCYLAEQQVGQHGKR